MKFLIAFLFLKFFLRFFVANFFFAPFQFHCFSLLPINFLACTAERFFRIDRAQEHLHYVVDICNDDLYILDHQLDEKDDLDLFNSDESGTDDVEVRVTILDKPSAPEAPLEIQSVHAEGCKLKWKSPEDDGSMPLDGYHIEKMNESTGKWLSMYNTRDLEDDVVGLMAPEHNYKFRVSFAKNISLSFRSEESFYYSGPFIKIVNCL